MTSFKTRPLVKNDKKWVGDRLKEWWAGPLIVTRGKVHRADMLPGFIAEENGRLIGLITYEIAGDRCEIITMNSRAEGKGVGTGLVDAVRKKTAEAGCKRLWLITTNDNTTALRFWQKRGFSLVAVHRNAVEKSRTLKPEIPLIGNNGIPLRDEIELEMVL
jgi:N-acetylglutamate synthase-like GNAT family acetyltransferase